MMMWCVCVYCQLVWVLGSCNGLLGFDIFFFFKQKTAYEMRISDWSSDVCSSDLDENSIPGFTFDLLEHAATSEKGRSRRNAGAGRVKITPRPLLASA